MTNKFRKLKLKELNRISPAAFKEAEKIPVAVVLDNIRSLHNIGSVFRTCDAFRVSEVILSGFTAQPPHREIHKTALGATDTVKWSYHQQAEDAIKMLQASNYTIIAAEQSTNSIPLQEINMEKEEKIAVVFGNEVDGVSDPYINSCKYVVEIPQEGTKHSLNVSVSAGIVLWELFKQLR